MSYFGGISIVISYMPRQKKSTVARSVRLLEEVAAAVDLYADNQLISSNAAVNKLLRDRLAEIGYMKPGNDIQSYD
jgi:hypothetical protein